MPVFQYFGWVGGFLLATLLVADWCFPAPPPGNAPLDQKVHIQIHTDQKWPERVVMDTTRWKLAQDQQADGKTDVVGSAMAAPAEHQPFEAFAEMAPAAGPCFRPPCHTVTARNGFTLPSRLHKLPGRS